MLLIVSALLHLCSCVSPFSKVALALESDDATAGARFRGTIAQAIKSSAAQFNFLVHNVAQKFGD